jgi:hypothetical protein
LGLLLVHLVFGDLALPLGDDLLLGFLLLLNDEPFRLILLSLDLSLLLGLLGLSSHTRLGGQSRGDSLLGLLRVLFELLDLGSHLLDLASGRPLLRDDFLLLGGSHLDLFSILINVGLQLGNLSLVLEDHG